MSDKQIVTTTKEWHQSRTLWINALTVIAMILTFVIDTQTVGGLPFSLDPRWVSLALGVVNIFLRMDTTKPINGSGA